MPTLHSLLIGINEYPPSVSKLGGCVNDCEALDNYLSAFAEQQGWGYRPLLLLNEQATRQGIIDGFRHFDAAQDGDVCVWSYSGHGSRAPAPKAFWHQAPDHLHECLVCWDSRKPGGRVLLDKEMSWLVWKATTGKDVHFLVLMDCCFSGTNLRLEGSRDRRVEMPDNAKPLPLDAYLGIADYTKDGKGYYSPPRGRYLQLAASRPDQPAREMHLDDRMHGVFTYSLLEQLKVNGQPLSYAELYQRIHARVGSIVPEQSPQLDSTDFYRQLFLRQEKPMKGASHWVVFQRDSNDWVLKMGSLDGVKPEKPGQASVHIAEKGISARIRETHPSYSVIELGPGHPLSRKKVYSAQVQNLGPRMLLVALAPDFPKAERPALEAAFTQASPEYLELVAAPKHARYWVYLNDNKELTLCPRGGLRPAFQRMPLSDAFRFWLEADKLGRWDYVRLLSNPEPQLPKDALTITMYQMKTASNYTTTSPKKLVRWPRPLWLDYRYIDGKWRYPAFQCEVTNTSEMELWVGALFLGNDYSISNDVLTKVLLKPGEKACLRYRWEGKESIIIRNGIEDSLLEIGVTRNPETIKVIASTEEIFLERYEQEGVKPEVLRDDRGLVEKEPREDIHLSDWMTYDICLITRRPLAPQALIGNHPAHWFGHRLDAPAGFWSNTALFTLEDIREQLPKRIKSHLAAAGDYTPYEWTPGFNRAPGLKVLSLYNVEGEAKVSAAHPLSISLPQGSEGVRIMPLAYEESTGTLSEIPHSSQPGRILLEQLPLLTCLKNGEKHILVFLHYLGEE